AATKLTIERGRRNLEILKQAQYSPVSVEEQVAIIYCATNGLMDNVPVEEVKAFEKDFLRTMRAQHNNALLALKAGKLDDETTATLKQVAREVSAKYKK
ncbi:MAG: F0F1 ATP synthase subunit alpha, partial [Hymenobacteraceae bacterium]|nr:F0F1 ATP synthase subunit alpha [Hymenobacteraceae bacterium]